MPSQPDETIDQDLAHIMQFVRLARGLNTAIVSEALEMTSLLTAIEARAEAALAKLQSPRMPIAYLTGDSPVKLLRFYWCMACGVNHWEDDRAAYDEHILHAGQIEYGHRPTLHVLRGGTPELPLEPHCKHPDCYKPPFPF